MVRRYFVPTRLLQVGMKIDQSIVDGTNRVLIARGAELDAFMINGLSKLGISGVYIREGEEEMMESSADEPVAQETLETIDKLKVQDRKSVSISESVRERGGGGFVSLQ